MRVQNPDQYAAVLLNMTMPNEHYTPEKIRSMYGSSEIDLKFPTPIPVNITYQTAFVDDAGKLQIRRDVYGRDATMIALLQKRPEQGSGKRRRPFAAELFPPTGGLPGRRQLRQRQHLFVVRTVVLRTAVRRTAVAPRADRPAPPSPSRGGYSPADATYSGTGQQFSSKINGLAHGGAVLH